MSLLSNSLFLDSEYKADCEFKINYLNIIKNNKVDADFNNDENNQSDVFVSDDPLTHLLTKVIKADKNERPYFSDSKRLYKTKKISDNYYKIMFEELNQSDNYFINDKIMELDEKGSIKKEDKTISKTVEIDMSQLISNTVVKFGIHETGSIMFLKDKINGTINQDGNKILRI